MKFFGSPLRLLFILVLLPLLGHTQYYLSGQDPASIRWKQIYTPSFRLIFPEGLDSTANLYLSLLEESKVAVSSPYLKKNKRFPIVLHNQSTISNAMVSPTPMHADFYIMPDQNTYAQSWEKQLALHEYRHVAQIQKVSQGVGKGLYYIFGEQAIGAMMGLFVPFWFVEGDAVLSETLLSKSGRGRSPDFTMDLKAQLLDKKPYNYDKALYGSYKDYVPDHYTLGFELIRLGVEKYGMDIWSHSLDKVSKRPYTFAPFSLAIKDKTNYGKVMFYGESMKELRRTWRAEKAELLPKVQLVDVKPTKHFTNYRFPTLLSNGGIICEKTSIDDINRFVLIKPDGNESILFTPGFDYVESLTANDSMIVWNEKVYDIRWSNRDYSVVKSYNFLRKDLNVLTKKSRLFAPALSPDGSQIVAVNASTNNQYSLLIFDASDGSEIMEVGVSDSLFLMTPKWSADGAHIISIVLGDKGKSIMLTNTSTGENHFPLSFHYGDIKSPIMRGDSIIFVGSYSGTSNIYLMRLGGMQLHQITNVPYGANDPSVSADGRQLLFASYTADGYRLAKSKLTPMGDQKLPVSEWESTHTYPVDRIVPKNGFILDDIKIKDTAFTVEKYSRAANLFNPHSWGLAAVDLSNYEFTPGINILSQNLLSTSVSTLGYYYDLNEQRGKLKFGFDYLGWYPAINLSAEYAGRRSFLTAEDGSKTEVMWHETDVSTTISLPLHFTKSKWVRGMRPALGGTQKFLSLDKGTHDSIQLMHDRYTLLTHNLYAYTYLKKSMKSIFPRWGIYLNTTYRHTILASDFDWQMAATASFYIPGLFRHQGLRLYAGYEQKGITNYAFSTLVSIPRGYTNISSSELLSLKADYVFPILYPDLALPAIFYLKRVYGQVYYDHLLAGSGFSSSLSSTGMELYTDWHFFSLLPEFKLGVRYVHQIDPNTQFFEFLFGFSY